MKKLVSLILILCMACMMIPAMAEEDMTGEWYADLYGMEVTLTLNTDQSAKMTLTGMGDIAEYTWVESNGLFVLTETTEGAKLEGSYKDGEIRINDGEDEFVFTREHVEGIQVAEVNPDAAAEEFEGTWAISSVRAEGVHARAADVGLGEIGAVIEKGTITFTGNTDDISFFFGKDPIQMTYENGGLNYKNDIVLGEETVEGVLACEMLQDGMLALTVIINGDGVTYFFTKAAAE